MTVNVVHRKGSARVLRAWVPAFAGMTASVVTANLAGDGEPGAGDYASYAISTLGTLASSASSIAPVTGLRRKPWKPEAIACGSASASARAVTASKGPS